MSACRLQHLSDRGTKLHRFHPDRQGAKERPEPGQIGRAQTASALGRTQTVGDFERPDRGRHGFLSFQAIQDPVGPVGRLVRETPRERHRCIDDEH
jgi:hypothetical protein